MARQYYFSCFGEFILHNIVQFEMPGFGIHLQIDNNDLIRDKADTIDFYRASRKVADEQNYTHRKTAG